MTEKTLQSNEVKRTSLEYSNELIIWKLNLLIRFNNAGIMHSFLECLDQKSISACLLPKRIDFIAVITFNKTYVTFSVNTFLHNFRDTK